MTAIVLENGKYTVISDPASFVCLRYGEPWRDMIGDKLMHAMFDEIERLQAAPIDMILHCPACGMQHIDAPAEHDETKRYTVPATPWTNPPHRSHLCHGCGHIWRPADVATNGVAAIKTEGKDDSPPADPAQAGRAAERAAERAAYEAGRAAERAECNDLEGVLIRNGFVRCDIAACNCRSWHARYGLPERMQELKDALADAGHPLCNDNGHLIHKALAQLIAERDALAAERAEWVRDDSEFEVIVSEEMHAACTSGPRERALAEAMNYARQYTDEGPVQVFEIHRKLVASLVAVDARLASASGENAA